MAVELLGGIRIPPLRERLHQKGKGELLLHVQVGEQVCQIDILFAVQDAGERQEIGNVACCFPGAFAGCIQIFCFHWQKILSVLKFWTRKLAFLLQSAIAIRGGL